MMRLWPENLSEPLGVVEIAAVDCWVLRAPTEAPVRTAFGEMSDRPCLLVRVTDTDEIEGWGEVWCNFPRRGAEYRASLIADVIAPLLAGRRLDSPEAGFDLLTARTRNLQLQTGDLGPLAQAIAGVDQAVWDLFARRAAVPLCQALGGTADSVRAYASGIGPETPGENVARLSAAGFRAFKVKVGFGSDRDRRTLSEARAAAGSATLMADANQGWNPAEAAQRIDEAARFDLHWIEEPVPADSAPEIWAALAQGPTPLAAGENAADLEALAEMRDGGALRFLQPDVGKIGGVTGIARTLKVAGPVYCPHWLGGAVGLAVSAHLLAAFGAEGFLEVDSNPNPIRDMLTDWNPVPDPDGRIGVPEGPGTGVRPDLDRMRSAGVKLRSIA